MITPGPPAVIGDWIQTVPGNGLEHDRPGQGLEHALSLYSPLETFFDKTWRPSEIEKLMDAREWQRRK